MLRKAKIIILFMTVPKTLLLMFIIAPGNSVFINLNNSFIYRATLFDV